MRFGNKKIDVLDKGWRLDYFLINKDHFHFVKDSLIHNQYDGSDHYPIELILDIS